MNIWSGKFGDKYTERNSPDVEKRAKWFDKILPKSIKSVHEIGCNKGHNLVAINKVRQVNISGNDLNKSALKHAQKRGVFIKETGFADLYLLSGVLMHQNPIDIDDMFSEIDFYANKYILMIEHKTDSIQTINTRWYKNAMWTMNTGKEFLDRYKKWKCIKSGYVNGKKGKGDFTAPLTNTKTGFHEDDYFWLLKRK